jgi:uncharacterized protein (TIGR03118 family)
MHRNSSIHPKHVVLAVLLLLSLALLPSSSEAVTHYQQTNLVADIPGLASVTDPDLKNPWGISHSPTSPFWVSNNGTGLSTLYNTNGVKQGLVVTIPPPSGAPGKSAPTGQVFNETSSFDLSPGKRALFIFATADGTISGWNPAASATSAILTVDNSASGAVYKGLAIGNNGSGDFLYAANFTGGSIDVFDANFSPTSLAGGFTDPNLPAFYAPFNIQKLAGELYVTYAQQNPISTNEELHGKGLGFVNVFDLNGNLARRLVSKEGLNPPWDLNAPWGLAIAPSSFGEFAGDLLVGNHGDGLINAFDPTSGVFQGTLKDVHGNPIAIDGLWGLIFGNGGNGGDVNTLYFSAGMNNGANGLFGSLAPTPLPGTLLLLGTGLLGILAVARRR